MNPTVNHFRHIVLFKLHDGVEAEKIAQAIKLLRKLASEPGIVDWVVTQSIDERKGIVIIENGLFTSKQAYSTFKSSPNHQKAGEYMRTISDWLIGDYVQNTSLAPV